VVLQGAWRLSRAAALAAHALCSLKGNKALPLGGKARSMSWGITASQQLGPTSGLLAERFEHVAPVPSSERVSEPELHLVGLSFGALHPGMDPAPLKADRKLRLPERA